MRFLLFPLIISFFSFSALAEEFTVFEKNGRYGLISKSGVIAVPAVHDLLGWSNGGNQVFEGVIGFKSNKLWGLISIKNKVLAENKFYTLSPLEGGYLKASVKGKFSNQLFYGLLDSKGEVKVSFNYFDLERKGEYLIVTQFEAYQSRVGLLSLDNKVIIPLVYKGVEQVGFWFVGNRFDYKKDIFFGSNRVAQNIDSIYFKKGLFCFQNGYVGFITENGTLAHEITYKKIDINQGKLTPIDFPTWEIHTSEGKLFERKCDSLAIKNGIWMMYLNGVLHVAFLNSSVNVSKEYELIDIVNETLIVRHTKTNLWSVLDKSGKVIISNQDHIEKLGNSFLTRIDSEWHIYNAFGSKINPFPLHTLKKGVDNYFVSKNNGYWGVVDFQGDTHITFKYDSIISGARHYAVKFLNKWGIANKHGNWRVYPDFDEMENYEGLIVGKKAETYSYFHYGSFLFKSTFFVSSSLENFLIIVDEQGKKGLLNKRGSVIAYPEFEAIRKLGNYFLFEGAGFSFLVNLEGEKVIGRSNDYQNFGEIGEDYISVLKNGRWGFIDLEGRLRISNRYEDVMVFKEGLAAIKLRGKWGFIDKNEKLIIQPYYEQVLSFQDGLAVVKSNGKYGLIDKKGEEIISINWASIHQTKNRNYLVTSQEGLVGIAGPEGVFVLRPNFDYLEDLKYGIIIRKNGKMGMLDYQGNHRHKLIFSDIRATEEFLLLKKEN